jgi:DNA-3-methyladenine glycosylase I
MGDLQRCPWAESDPLLRSYHDEEWGVPLHDSRAMWELLMLEGFQAGLAWITVLRKREALRKAFRGFVPHTVARFGKREIDKMLTDPGIIRSRAKIEATIIGARVFVDMERQGEDFATFAWGLAGGKPSRNKTGKVLARSPLSEEISAALKKKGFKFVGPVIVYAWMQATGMVNDHDPRCFRA